MYNNPALTNAGSTRTRPSIAVVDLKTKERMRVELEIGETLYVRCPAGSVQRVERQQLPPERWEIIEASPMAGAA
ncbi:hypothetical protein [Pseudomonas sp. GD03730]|uniref:hypothetical protein n=1 Tax=Pseudomonas sp. GD03730 TaxID=2975375 RepID=UPI00244D49EF|nr:hypothetical protein [Pseudomonas sp. GD03730]MDH1403726.1 hypothetical protein [Pseudomonas sp. GD03730]